MTHASHTHHHSDATGIIEGVEPSVAARRAAASGSVALDIGPGIGALVIYPGESYRGREIEISRADADDDRRVHTGVLDRATAVGTVLAATFGSLPEGDYVVWRDASTQAGTASVVGGSVIEFKLLDGG